MRSRTAGVMTTLMRNGRDRRSGKPVKCHARKERVLLFGTRSADYIRASGQSGRIQRPNTWLHPNASLKCPIFPLHRGRRPYMALRVIRRDAPSCPSDTSGHRADLSPCPLINGLALAEADRHPHACLTISCHGATFSITLEGGWGFERLLLASPSFF